MGCLMIGFKRNINVIPDEIRSLNPDELDLDPKAKILIQQLLGVIEQMAQTIQELQRENQKLKDEICRLKGEKGRPHFKPNVPRKENDVCREKESKEWKKSDKKSLVKIDRAEVVQVNQHILPPDAEHKGYRSVIVQNVKFETDNVEYQLERYYSPGEQRVYEAELPKDVDGGFGADLKAFVMSLYFACRVPEEKIRMMLTEARIIISEGQISNILTKAGKEKFTQEKEDIFEAGMSVADCFHIDDTGARHKGVNHHVQVICTLLFSVFFITRKKDRNTILGMLGLNDGGKIKKIMVSDDAKQFMFIAAYHALCWVHEIRHYRKLNPVLDYHRTQLHKFLTEIWEFYEQLKEYKKQPSKQQKRFLEQRFDTLFSTETGYQELDERIQLTRKKKKKLLLVLTYPQIPLHNNPAEIALRELVIKKRISYGTKSDDGKTAWENMMTILDTCRKHNVSFLDYVKDIFSKRYAMPRLSTLILEKAKSNPTNY
jgi:hypothetical protein